MSRGGGGDRRDDEKAWADLIPLSGSGSQTVWLHARASTSELNRINAYSRVKLLHLLLIIHICKINILMFMIILSVFAVITNVLDDLKINQ